MASLPTHLSTTEAAERLADAGLNVNAAMVRRWVKKDQIPYTRLPNGRAQVPASAIDALIPKPESAAVA